MSTNQPGGRPPSAAMTGWEVKDQVPATDLDGSGQPQRGVRVHFVTGRGYAGNVFVADGRYTPENVRAEVAAKAALMDQVGQLKG